MLKAQQELLAQEASNALIGIKNTEFQYYIDFTNSLGVMFTFIAGYQLSTMNGVGPMDTSQISLYVYTETFQNLYWVLTVMSIFFSLEGLLVSVYLVVFGQALALQGPTGSVNKAIEILKRYQKHLLLTFSLTLLTLGLATIAGFWYVMSWYGAAICSVVAIFGMFSWHVHTVEIYNATKFIPTDSSDFGDRDSYVDRQDVDVGLATTSINSAPNSSSSISVNKQSASSSAAAGGGTRPSHGPSRASVTSSGGPEEVAALSSPFVSAWRALTRGGRRKAFPSVTVTDDGSHPSEWAQPAASAFGGNISGPSSSKTLISKRNPLNMATYADRHFTNIVFDGTVDLRVVIKHGASGGNKWNRRYIVVTAEAIIMIYTSAEEYKQCHRSNAGTSSCACKQFRPIDISGYAFKTSMENIVTLSPLDNYMAAIELQCLDDKEFQRLIHVIGIISQPVSA